jgi:hypothetical protein
MRLAFAGSSRVACVGPPAGFDVQAVHDAAHESEEEAARREDRMSSSAKSIREQVELLREVAIGWTRQPAP